MTAELGQYSLLLALLTALFQGVIPLIGAARGQTLWMNSAIGAGRAQFLFLATAFLCLIDGFIENDFSIFYVASHSNSALPLYYRIAATWGAHEGSMLLWAFILSGWTFAVTLFSGALPAVFRARVLAIMGLTSFGILLFIQTTSNPFLRLVPMPPEGHDLNPLLQDFGMTIHPPMLYMGYVGLAVAFSFAIAALLGGTLDAAWSRWSRPWTLIAWIFLTFGIVLGSWWAYYELGWGGWWFWDPVENASFMPWLVATALLHSLAATEKRGAFKSWTVLLAIFAFSLSLLGTFLVRSGVLTSVHAFASDPARGLFILVFLALVVGSSLLLYAIRAPGIQDNTRFGWFSRESLLLINNILLVTASASILLGTLYPLVLDALKLGKISVGSPYFARVFVPLMTPIVLLAGISGRVPWREGDVRKNLLEYLPLALPVLVIAIGFGFLVDGPRDISTFAGLGAAFWLIASQGLTLYKRLQNRSTLFEGVTRLSPSFIGMNLAHLGLAVFVVGVTVSGAHSEEKIARMAPGETVAIGDYRFTFKGIEAVSGPNYRAQEGLFEVRKDEDRIAFLTPQKRVYQVQKNPMTEAAIDPGFTRDLYVALGEPLDNSAWSVRLYVKPFIRWIWFGGLFMMAGGFFSLLDRRYRLGSSASKPLNGAL
jgi:cytochrome c-type biogenesis protein CcmF